MTHSKTDIATAVLLSLVSFLLLSITGCRKDLSTAPDSSTGGSSSLSESIGKEYLVAVLDELDAIAAAEIPVSRMTFAKSTAESVFVYGAVSPTGTGMVVTERHTYPKGILLITVKKSYGGADGRIVSGTWKYTSPANMAAGNADEWSVTEVYAAVADTIITKVTKSTGTETYTFTLPVVTVSVNTSTDVTQTTTRKAVGHAVVSEIMDEDGALVKRTTSLGLASGAVRTLTEQSDGSWRDVVTLGQADGSVLKTVTTGS